MRFRRTGRRPEGTLSTQWVLSFLLLPLLLGGGDSADSRPGPSLSFPVDDPTPTLVWLFLTEDAFESREFHRGLEQLPLKVRTRSDWLKAVSVESGPSLAAELGRIPGVIGVRAVAKLAPPPAPRGPAVLQQVDSLYGDLAPALEALGVPQAHALGFDGTGIRLGILDGTFREGHSTLRNRSPLAARDFVDLDGSVSPEPGDPPEAASHGTALWSLVSGDLPGVLRGVAPGIDVLLARIRGLGELTPADEDRWVAGLEWLESRGASIVVSGVSFRHFAGSGHTIDDLNGAGTPATLAADEAAFRGVLVVSPVGNQGPGPMSLESPADGDSVLAAGAVDIRGIPAAFSAQGPTGDGRGKPDLFAPGTVLPAASGLGDQIVERVTGTEFSGALLAGAGALVVEAYPERGPMELLEILRRSAPADSGSAVGVPHVASAILFPDGVTVLPVEEVDGEGQVTTLSPQFRWNAPTIHPLGLPVTFHLELAEDSLFRVVSTSDSVVGTFARRLPGPLPPGTRLFWRIRARSVQGVERSTGAMGPLLIPSWVSLGALNDPAGTELVDPQPTFRWSALPLPPPSGPLTFDLQVVSDREADVIQNHPGLEVTLFKVPSPLPFNVPLRWRVIARTEGAADTVTSAGPFVIISGANPPATILYQNFPNPFPDRETGTENTRIWFDLAESATVELSLFDIRGRLVRRLIPARDCPPAELPAGIYGRAGGPPEDACTSFSWDGLDDRDRDAPPGVYLLRLRAGGVVDVRRVVLWR